MFSVNSLSEEDDKTLYTTEFLESLNISGLPPHELKLKKHSVIMLLRTISVKDGACNGTRLMVTKLSRHLIEATIIHGTHAGQSIFISRMNMSPSDTPFPFKLSRRQFPIRLAYGLTINKSQGQTFTKVGVYLPQPVFTHGQLYVALSRVGSYDDVSILADYEWSGTKVPVNGNIGVFTENIVYYEILR